MIDFGEKRRGQQSMILTSMVDVVFLLTIFFMLTSSFVKTESIELSLPPADKAASVAPESNANIIVIVLADEKRVFLGRSRVTEQELSEKLKLLVRNNPDRKILLMSSEVNSVQEVVAIMDVIYQAGGRNIAVANWKPRES
ncbi:MAG: biopolymer transporter ExbD [Alphaproteobacteria bacterium]|nr:biopolymer transporter ExbD [Alphaproteobacteria bacterium]